MECRKQSVRKNGYTVITNHILQNEKISLKAKGLYCFMQSKPDGWAFSVIGLAAQNRDGKDAVCSAISELKSFGYLRIQKEKDEKGMFSSVFYILFDEPQTEEPYAENPDTEKPDEENQPLVITEEVITEEDPPIVPHGGPVLAKHKPERFEAFWKFYPTDLHPCQSKAAARKAWDRLHADDSLLDDIGRYIRDMMQTKQWQDGIGVPYASTMLNRIRRDGLPERQEEETMEPEFVLVTGEDGVRRWERRTAALS